MPFHLYSVLCDSTNQTEDSRIILNGITNSLQMQVESLAGMSEFEFYRIDRKLLLTSAWMREHDEETGFEIRLRLEYPDKKRVNLSTRKAMSVPFETSVSNVNIDFSKGFQVQIGTNWFLVEQRTAAKRWKIVARVPLVFTQNIVESDGL